MESESITAIEMANEAGIDQKAFRRALRAEKLPWHRHNDRWTMRKGSREHADMQRVLDALRRNG